MLNGPYFGSASGLRNPAQPAATPLQRLLDGRVGPGAVVWIGLRPARREAMRIVPEAVLESTSGLVGDRYAGRSGTRQVSLVAEEDLRAIAGFVGRPVPPEALRRNIVVRGINLLALKGRRFRLGSAVLAFSGECHPCSRMEETLGPGGYNAVRGHGGILARVVSDGVVRVGDDLVRLDDETSACKEIA